MCIRDRCNTGVCFSTMYIADSNIPKCNAGLQKQIFPILITIKLNMSEHVVFILQIEGRHVLSCLQPQDTAVYSSPDVFFVVRECILQ